jgi:hypothetical protein
VKVTQSLGSADKNMKYLLMGILLTGCWTANPWAPPNPSFKRNYNADIAHCTGEADKAVVAAKATYLPFGTDNDYDRIYTIQQRSCMRSLGWMPLSEATNQ